jgi:hypothetical protein
VLEQVFEPAIRIEFGKTKTANWRIVRACLVSGGMDASGKRSAPGKIWFSSR